MRQVRIEEPRIVQTLLSDRRWSLVWVALRLWLGWQWLEAGWHKVGVEAWTGNGAAIRGFWERIVEVPEVGRPAITYDWYRSFIQFLLDGGHHTWFAKVIVYGEILIGVALIVGAFVGIAALFGAFMNLNFMLAGTTSTNPVLLMAAIGLILAWRVAGYWGLDRWLLTAIGTPWQAGSLFDHHDDTKTTKRPGAIRPSPNTA